MISHDPSKWPKLTLEFIKLANDLDKKPVKVLLRRPDDPEGLELKSLVALVDFLPRIGEIVVSSDRQNCRVKEIGHELVISDVGTVKNVPMFVTVIIAVLEVADGQ